LDPESDGLGHGGTVGSDRLGGFEQRSADAR